LVENIEMTIFMWFWYLLSNKKLRKNIKMPYVLSLLLSISFLNGKVGQLPHIGLMALSMRHGGGVTIGTGGGCEVTSASRALLHFYQVGYGLFIPFHCRICALLCSVVQLCVLFSLVLFWPSFSAMPRERGKPKRGPSWYCYAARQRRLCELAQASSTTLIQRNKESKTPPMAYVEEEILKEPITVPPDSLLYTVPDLHDRPNTSLPAIDTTTALEGATCIVQEEIPWADRPTEPPFPTSDMDRDLSSPCFLAPEHLELIFEMRRDMMEQLHRHTLLSSRIDMLFDAFSSMPIKQRCPTCAQPYVFTPHDGTLLTTTLWMAGSIVLIVPLMFKVYKLSTLPLQNTRIFLYYCLVFLSYALSRLYVQSFVACLDSSVTTLYCHLLWFPTVWRSKWWLLLLATRTKGCHLFRFPLVWRNMWQACDLELICTVTTCFLRKYHFFI
jgi:hypothetical protein